MHEKGVMSDQDFSRTLTQCSPVSARDLEINSAADEDLFLRCRLFTFCVRGRAGFADEHDLSATAANLLEHRDYWWICHCLRSRLDLATLLAYSGPSDL